MTILIANQTSSSPLSTKAWSCSNYRYAKIYYPTLKLVLTFASTKVESWSAFLSALGESRRKRALLYIPLF